VVKQRSKFFLFSTLLLVLALLSACGGSQEPSETAQNTTTPTATSAASQPASAATTTTDGQQPDGNYAFVRQNQLWVHLQGDVSGQLTKFDYTARPNAFWHLPLWSSDDHYLAFIMTALPAGLGGGGCPSPDYGANGALYVYDTQAKAMTQVSAVTPIPHAATSGQPQSDAWQYMFWEDATHLLAWYNGAKDGKNAGLYRYDLTAQTVKKVIALDDLDANTLYNGKTDDNKPLILSMRYSSGVLYYQTVKHPGKDDSTLSIYSHSVTKPDSDSKKVLDLGTEPWCNLSGQQQGQIVLPGWDVSPDGNHLVAQLVNGQAVMGVQEQNLQNGSSTQLFQQAPEELFGHDVLLSWSPDSQTVVATEPSIIAKMGPFTTSLANTSAVQTYTPYMRGPASWHADGSAFDLQNSSTGNGTALISGANTPPAIYEYGKGKTHGQAVLTDAHEIGWG
jgi:hypothetical protein